MLMMEENKEQKARDIEGSTKESQDNNLSFTRKIITTGFLAIGYIGTGCAFTLPGPSMIDLEIRMGATTTEISAMYTMRAIGSVLGCLSAGLLYDTFKADVVFIPFYMISAASIAIAPWWYHSIALSICLGLSGFSRSAVIVGVNIWCIRFWAPNHTSILLCLSFIKEAGASMVIPVVRALLLERKDPETLGNLTSNSSSVQKQSEQYLNTTMLINEFQPDDVKVQYAFLIPAFLYMVASLCHYVNMINEHCTFKERKSMSKSKTLGEPHIKNPGKYRVILLCVIFGILSFCNGCITDISFMFLFSFVVKHIHWPKADSALLLTAFAISVSSSPLLFTIISKYCRPPNSLWIAIILLVIPMSAFCTHLVFNRTVLWGAVILLGLGSGCIETLVPSWLASLLGPSGKWPAFCFGNSYLARIGAGWFVGYLFDEYGPIWFVYFLLITVIVFAVAHTFGYILNEVPLSKRKNRKIKVKQETGSQPQLPSQIEISEVTNISVL